MAGDTQSPQRTRHSSRAHEIKMESDVNTPRAHFSFSRGQTPNGKSGKGGNNRFGNKGTEKCVRCRELKRACKFNNPDDTCDLCASKGYKCSPKVKSDQQAQIKAQTQGDIKGINAQRQYQWNAEENFLDNIIHLARNNLAPEKVVAKIGNEINLYLQGKTEPLPAPQVLGHEPNGYGYTPLRDAGPAPLQPTQDIHYNFNFIPPSLLQTNQVARPWGQAGLGYSPQPAHPVHGNQLAIPNPADMPQPIPQELRQGIPRLQTGTQLPTAPPQGLDTQPPDWEYTYDWQNDVYTRQDLGSLYNMSNMGTPLDFPMDNWDNGPDPI